MNIFQHLFSDIKRLGQNVVTEYLPENSDIWQHVSLEIPKETINGDISTNIAMLLAARGKKNPREIALKFKNVFSSLDYISHIEVAGPGFINFTIKQGKWQEVLKSILDESSDLWRGDIGAGKKVNIEYVSANPTGPMHIGHGRGAVYGDVLANILAKCGFVVTKEFYINDAGTQIDILVESLILRYKEVITGTQVEIPEGLYPGEYLRDLAKELVAAKGTKLLEMTSETDLKQMLKKFAVNGMMRLIKDDLEELGVKHEVFFSEQSLHDNGKVEEVTKLLEKKGFIYSGILPPPKGKIDETWEERPQLLFKSTDFGDDQDRPIQKHDGSWTYIAADIAYAKDKIDRGYDILVCILGADHGGYVKRIKAGIDVLSDGKVSSGVYLTQLVNFTKDGEAVKMSKRSGNFMTIRDVIQEVGADSVRFMMLTRRGDMVIDFDFDKVKEQSKDNPVFYVQYAHVRAGSIIANAEETTPKAYSKFTSGNVDLSLLASEEEINLIKLLSAWPKYLQSAAVHFEPHRIVYYLIDVASRFHSLWNLGKENNHYRFVIDGDEELTAARLALAKAVQNVIRDGLGVMGVTPMKKM